MSSTERLAVSIFIVSGAFIGFAMLATLAFALPEPIDRFGVLLPGIWLVLIVVNLKSLPERIWALWLKVRREP